MERRHVCFVTRELPPALPFGGIGTYVHTLSATLARRGHEVTIIALAGREPMAETLPPEVWVLRVPPAVASPGLRSILTFARDAADAALQIHRDRPIDVIEAPDYLAQALFLKARLPAVRLVVRHHGGYDIELTGRRRIPPRNPRWYAIAALETAALLQADMASAVSFHQAAIVRLKQGFAKIPVTVIPNPLAIPDPPERRPEGPPWHILFVGRLEPNKRPWMVAEALALLLTRGRDCVLDCIGPDTPLTGRFRSMSGRMLAVLPESERGRIRFHGRLPHDAVAQAMARAVALCLPSRHEGFPMVVGEAMACGVPVVATRGTAMDEIVLDGMTGMLAGEDDVAGMASALEVLMMDPRHAATLGAAARERARSLYAPDVVARMFEDKVLMR